MPLPLGGAWLVLWREELRRVAGPLLVGAGLVVVGVVLSGTAFAAVAALALWGALSLLILGAAYLLQLVSTEGSRLFLKRADGWLHPGTLLACLPFIASKYVNVFIQRLVIRETPLSDVDGGVLVGGRIFPWEKTSIVKERVSAVLDTTAELPKDFWLRDSNMAYLAVPVLDGTEPTVEQLEKGVGWALERLGRGDRVLVQCTMGHGRSATFAAALLVLLGKAETVDDAERLMRAKRPRVGLSQAQKRSVQRALEAGRMGSAEGMAQPVTPPAS